MERICYSTGSLELPFISQKVNAYNFVLGLYWFKMGYSFISSFIGAIMSSFDIGVDVFMRVLHKIIT